MYAAEVDGQRLTFHAHAVWRRNMIMRDRETGSLWQQATGRALIGPLAGHELRVLPATRTRWDQWLPRHPETVIPVPPAEWEGMLSLAATERLLVRATDLAAPPGRTAPDRRLPWDEPVLGIGAGGEALAVPLRRLPRSSLLHTTVGGQPILVVRRPRSDEVAVYERPEGRRFELVEGALRSGTEVWKLDGQPEDPTLPALEPVPSQRTRWLGWYEFHPETGILEPARH